MVGERVGISEVSVGGRVTGVVRTLFFTGEGEIDFIRPGVDRKLEDIPPSETVNPGGWPPED